MADVRAEGNKDKYSRRSPGCSGRAYELCHDGMHRSSGCSGIDAMVMGITFSAADVVPERERVHAGRPPGLGNAPSATPSAPSGIFRSRLAVVLM